ncbi:MAG: hypothetical protein H7Y04_06645 [Verrucomicrobia bacterium]|nr:hypothetical protein [Cytophagales bacterium]
MKKAIIKFSFLALITLLSTTTNAQCSTEEFEKKCVEKLNSLSYTFLKTYKVDGENKTEVKYSYIFTRGSSYAITIASKDAENKGLVLNLYDSNKRLVGTNHAPDSKKYLAGVNYACNTTGIYYLVFTFENPRDKCAAGVLGFKKQ